MSLYKGVFSTSKDLFLDAVLYVRACERRNFFCPCVNGLSESAVLSRKSERI